tara:strand:- start:509 stop:844 length:336 start_codon:yes stop_codon:yes gene_type:complete
MKQLTNVVDALKIMSDVYYKFTVNHARVFLYIAAHRDEIIETRDLISILDITQSSLNRTIRSMAHKSYLKEEGMGLIALNMSPEDERQRIVTLTPKGLEMAMKMENKIYGK